MTTPTHPARLADVNRVDLAQARPVLATLGVPDAATADETTLRVILATALATNVARLCACCSQVVIPPTGAEQCGDCDFWNS